MPTIFIIHGAYGHPLENWFPWLKRELEKQGHNVFVPAFPTPEGQTLNNWKFVFKPYVKFVDGSSVFVGHSLGPAFILSILEELEKPVKACFFVSGFVGSLGNEEFDRINRTFAERKFNWEKIRKNCGNFVLFHSDNDPYVPLEKAEELAGLVGGELIVVKGAGHFNEMVGYREFPDLLAKITSII